MHIGQQASRVRTWNVAIIPQVTSTDIAGFDNQKKFTNIQNNLSVNIKIPWIEGLTIRGNGSYDKAISITGKKFEKTNPVIFLGRVNKNSSGLTAAKRYVDNAQLSREHSDATSWMVNGLIDYNRYIRPAQFRSYVRY